MDMSWGEVRNTGSEPGENVQGSEAWLKWRGKGLGSSDAAVLLGWSPWKNIKQLLDEKLGLWKPVFGSHQRSAMERGKELEPKIREWYEHTEGALFPDGIATHPAKEYLRASFDGINKTIKNEDGSIGRIIEIKAPNSKDHELAKLNQVSDKYVAQVQWLLLIANIPWCDYVSYGSDGTYAVVHVKADPVIQRELEERAALFWKHVETKVQIIEWPKYEASYQTNLDLSSASAPHSTEKAITEAAKAEDPKPVQDQEIEAIVAEALLLQDEAKASAARFEAKKAQLQKILGKEKEMKKGQGVFGWQERKGSVDYSIIPELIGLDLDQFRKQPTRAFYLKRVDDKE